MEGAQWLVRDTVPQPRCGGDGFDAEDVGGNIDGAGVCL